jgi:uncharacterized membrane protein YccC
VLPLGLFIGSTILHNPMIATFAAFGAFAMTLLAVIEGDLRQRVQGQVALAAAGAVLLCLGTLASQSPALAAVSMGIVGFVVLFSSVLSSALTNVAPALLLAFVLPVSLSVPPSALSSRLAGWALASVGAVLATALLWPAPRSEPLRARAVEVCRALVAALVVGEAADLDQSPSLSAEARLSSFDAALKESVASLRQQFNATPYRPASLSVESRALLPLVDQLTWVNSVFTFWTSIDPLSRRSTTFLPVRQAMANVLDASARLLSNTHCNPAVLRDAIEHLKSRSLAYESQLTLGPSPEAHAVADAHQPDQPTPDVAGLQQAIDASFRLQETAHGVTQVGTSALAIAEAEQRTWRERLLGQRREGLPSTTSVARTRLASHFTLESVWLHNSVRGAVTLALATLVATEIGLQHAFWVVLGAMAVLRSNALATGQNALRAVLGTTVGFLIGGTIVFAGGSHDAALWALLPVAIVFAGVAPAAVSFTAGQAAFTVLVIVMYNLISPVGWKVGATRIQDVGIGCAVSLIGGLLFWPRGASAMLRGALGGAYVATASFLTSAITYASAQAGLASQGDASTPDLGATLAALEASIRLDDAFRTYLNERGTKRLPLCETTSLVTGVTRLRLAGDSIVALWREPGDLDPDDPARLRRELDLASSRIESWFGAFGATLATGATLSIDAPRDRLLARLLPAIEPSLGAHEHETWWSALRVAWTVDFLDAVEIMQSSLAELVPERRLAHAGAVPTSPG